MQHLDPDVVGLAALGEPLHRESSEHLEQCDRCMQEIATLTAVVRAAKAGGPEQGDSGPEPAVWLAIEEQLGLSADLRPLALGEEEQDTTPAPTPIPLKGRRGGPGSRGISPWWLAAAASVGVIAGAGVVWGAQNFGRTGSDEVVARVELAPLPGYSAAGQATVTVADDGGRTLDVTVSGEPPEGYRQVWLIAPDLQQMYSVGLLDGDSGSFPIPADIDVAQFPIVDISDEPADGDPAHSGVSIVRGNIDVNGATGGV